LRNEYSNDGCYDIGDWIGLDREDVFPCLDEFPFSFINLLCFSLRSRVDASLVMCLAI